jgi:hypothetical protein
MNSCRNSWIEVLGCYVESMYRRTSTFFTNEWRHHHISFDSTTSKDSHARRLMEQIHQNLSHLLTYYISCVIPNPPNHSLKPNQCTQDQLSKTRGRSEIQQPLIRGRKQVSLNCSCTIPNLPKLSSKLELVCPPLSSISSESIKTSQY